MSQLTVAVDMGPDGVDAVATAPFTVAPRFGINYDVDGGILNAASTLGCAPLTLAKVFNSSMPASFPGHAIPATVTHPFAAIKLTLTAAAPYISSTDQAGLARVFGSMPKTGTPIVTIDQEGEAGRFSYSPAQVVGSHSLAYSIFQAHAPANAMYCQDFQTFSAAPQGRGLAVFENYVCCEANGGVELPLRLLDWYPSSPTTDAVDSILPAWTALRAMTASDSLIGIAECNYTTQLSTGITWTGGTQAQWFSDAWTWALANDAWMFMPYFLTAHGVPWPPSAATITELSAIAHASGL